MLTCQGTDDTLSIAGKLQVHFLDQVLDCLGAALNQTQPLTVDVSAVSEVDLAGLQLLLSFMRTRQASSPTSLRGVQPFMNKAMQLSGLESHFAGYVI
ncbi:MAG: STAS domain-containing protein [Pseudomonadota bacterium]